MPNPEGKLGVKGPHDKAEVPGEARRGAQLGGMAEVLDGETGKEIKSTLNSINNVAGALSGLNSTNVVLGGGPGTGLKGTGTGGGGVTMGVPYGAGGLTTGGGGGGPGGAGGGGGGGAGGGGGGPNETKVNVGAGAAAARGGLTPDQIQRVVLSHKGAMRACYESELQKNPGLKGGVTFVWSIDPSGSVSGVSVASSSLGNPRAEGCMSRQIKSWRFPTSDSPTTVGGFPFKFGV
jgi:hypothetical protein